MISSGYQAAEVRRGYQSYKKEFIREKLNLHYSPHSSQCTENRKYHTKFIHSQCLFIWKCNYINNHPVTVSQLLKICNFKHTYLYTCLQNSVVIGVTYSFLEIRHLFQGLILRLPQQEHHPSGEENKTLGCSFYRFLPDQVATG